MRGTLFMRKNHLKHMAQRQQQSKARKKEMAKYGETKQHTETLADGTEVKFKFQHLGVRETMKMVNRTEGDSEKRLDELLEHVIRFDTEDVTQQKVSWTWFDEQPNGFELAIKLGNAAFGFLVGVNQK